MELEYVIKKESEPGAVVASVPRLMYEEVKRDYIRTADLPLVPGKIWCPWCN